MKYQIAAVLSAILVTTAPVSAQVLYNNGVAKGGAGAFGLTTDPGTGFGGADASQANPDYAYGAASPQFADDFSLLSSSNVTSFTVYSYVTGSSILSSPISSTTINIYNGQPGAGGSIIATSSEQVSSVFTNVYRTRSGLPAPPDTGITGNTRPIFATTVSFTGLTLSAGNYWFSFSQIGTGPVNVAGLSTLSGGIPQLIPGNALAFDASQANPWIPLFIARRDNTSSIRPELPFLVNGQTTAPEPSSLLLALLPATGVLAARYRRRARA